MNKKVNNIEDRNKDYQSINKEIWRTELGIRSISVMYDEHSSDKQSKENIFLLKDNIKYRLFSTSHQYLIYLKELSNSEQSLKIIFNTDPLKFNSFFPTNPHFDRIELELSSVFDSIVFHLSSVFDYLSHMICYICKKDKSQTLYWTKLAKSAHGQNNEFSNLSIKEIIAKIDNSFVGRLYDYRSMLLHNRRDPHRFTTSLKLIESNFNVKILASATSLKNFKAIRTSVSEGEVTLTYLSSWLIKHSLINIEMLLDALKDEIEKDSHFHKNMFNPKKSNSFVAFSYDPLEKAMNPISEGLWKKYKEGAASS